MKTTFVILDLNCFFGTTANVNIFKEMQLTPKRHILGIEKYNSI